MINALRFSAIALAALITTVSLFGCQPGDSPKAQLASTTSAQVSASEPAGESQFSTPLRTLADRHDLLIGAALQGRALRDDPTYRSLVAREFSSISPENGLKFKPLHPERDRFRFDRADQMVDFAKAHQMEVYGHVLVWHRSLPDWLTSREWSRDELQQIMRQHIQTVVGHFRGKVDAWDVVNEALGRRGERLRDTIWLKTIGPEYIAMAFRWAHEADPDARLFYNDYEAEGLNPKSDAVYRLVRDLKRQGVPIHGVGLQMHVRAIDAPSLSDVAANIRRLQELGLEVRITEMDVSLHHSWGRLTDKLNAQAAVFANMLQVCLNAPSCTGFTTWGVADHFSWIPKHYNRWDAPLLFDESFRPKPAHRALVNVLQNTRPIRRQFT